MITKKIPRHRRGYFICCHIYILDSHVFDVLSDYSYLSKIPQILLRFVLVVFQLTYAHGLGILLLLLYLSLSNYTILLVFSLSLFFIRYKISFFYILEQTLCDICNSNLYVINHYCC